MFSKRYRIVITPFFYKDYVFLSKKIASIGKWLILVGKWLIYAQLF
jgi:hypothetical protein